MDTVDKKTYTTIVAIGSNLGNRQEIIEKAIDLISVRVGTVMKLSKFYETPPFGNQADQAFLNGAVLLSCNISPHKQIENLLAIESELGRVRVNKWGNRTIDLDIVSIEENSTPIKIDTELLTVPHPAMLERDFVMIPVAEIHPHGTHEKNGLSFQKIVSNKGFFLNGKSFELSYPLS